MIRRSMRAKDSAPVLAALLVAACTAKPPSPAPGGGLASGSFTADLNGFSIHYEVHGRGPVLMTLPNSWGLSHEGLRAMYRPLEERLTMVYFDPRGMGASGPVREEADRGMAAVRADFLALRAHLKLDEVGAIGWSNGAINLVTLAKEHPEALSSAIFVHGMASFSAEDGRRMQAEHPDIAKVYARLMAEASRPGITEAEQTALLRKTWLEDYFPVLVADRSRAAETVDAVFRDARLSFPHFAHANQEASLFDFRADLPGIRVPSLVVAGAHDLLPPERVEVLARGIPGARFVVFPHSGHLAPVEEPEAFRSAVYGFLGVTDAPR